MAKCLKYGKNTYKPNILFDKIRSNPEFFAKKHGITGSDVEGVLGIGRNDSVDFQIPTPQKPKNLMPKSLIANIADTIRNGGKSAEVMNVVNNSTWFKGLGKSTQENLTFASVKATLVDSDKYHKENDKVKAKEKADAKIKDVKKTYKEKISDLREVYKNKIEEAKKNTAKSVKEKIADRLFHRKQAINGIKLLLSDKSIRDKVTHTDMIRLLGSAEQIYGARDFNKAFAEFEIKLESVITRAEKRLENKKTDEETKSELYKQIEGNVRSMVDNNAELKDIEAYYPDVNQRQLAVNAYNRIKNETISFTDAVKGVEEAKKQESDIINQNKSWTQRLKNWKEKFITNSIDRQWLPKKYLREIGASNTENRMINMAGAAAKAKHIFDIAYDRIFYGLNKEERGLLDSIIQQRRIIAIDSNREQRNLAPILHPNNQDKNTANAFLEAKKQELGEEKYNDLVKRSDAYFDSFRDLLGEMKSEGMINQDAYDSMVDIDYQPRLFLEHLLDYDGKFANEQDKSFRLEGAGLSKDLIRSLDEGSTGVLLSNSELLLATAISSRQRAIMANRMNKEFIQKEFPKAKAKFEGIPSDKVQQYEKNIADNKTSKGEEERFYRYFKELNSKIIDNPITGVNKNGNPVYKNETTPQGYKKAYYYDNGVRNEFFMEENLHDMWHDTIKGYMSGGAKQNVSMVTGSALIKTMATGNNPAFVIVNTPRDFVHTLAFSTEYSSFIPKGVWNLVTDLAKSVGEIRKYDKGDNSLMSKYMEYGGGMDFLNTQGMLKAESLLAKGINSFVDPKQQDLAKKVMSIGTAKILSRYSETMFRVAVFKRAIDNRVKEERKKNPDVKTIEDLPKDQQDYIYDYAVRQARDLMDFNQGGRIVKDAEAFIPYINAATQGTRVMFEQFRRNPAATTSKMLQITGMNVGGVIGMAMLAIAKFRDDDDERTSVGIFLDFRETLSPYQRENYFNIPTGYDRAAGTYKMTSIAKAQSFTPILSLTESIVENQMRNIEGKDEMSWKTMMGRVGFAFTNNVDPVGFSGLFTDGEGLKSIPDTGAKIATRNPLMKAMMTYATGYDFFFGQPLQDTQNKTLHNYEGSGSSKVEDFYKTLGINTGLSPIRTKAAVEGIVTSPTTNPFVGLMYGIADVALTDKTLLESVKGISSNDDGEFKASKLPVLNRLFRETSNYSRQLNVSAEIKGSSEFKSALEKEAQMKMKSDEIASRYKTPDALLKDVSNVRAEILDFSKKDTNIAEKMAKRIEGKVSRKDLDGRVWDIAYDTGTSNEAKAMLIMAYFGDVRGNAKIQSDLKEAKVWSKKVQEEYVKLLGSK